MSWSCCSQPSVGDDSYEDEPEGPKTYELKLLAQHTLQKVHKTVKLAVGMMAEKLVVKFLGASPGNLAQLSQLTLTNGEGKKTPFRIAAEDDDEEKGAEADKTLRAGKMQWDTGVKKLAVEMSDGRAEVIVHMDLEFASLPPRGCDVLVFYGQGPERICQNCGNKMMHDSNFCRKCGTRAYPQLLARHRITQGKEKKNHGLDIGYPLTRVVLSFAGLEVDRSVLKEENIQLWPLRGVEPLKYTVVHHDTDVSADNPWTILKADKKNTWNAAIELELPAEVSLGHVELRGLDLEKACEFVVYGKYDHYLCAKCSTPVFKHCEVVSSRFLTWGKDHAFLIDSGINLKLSRPFEVSTNKGTFDVAKGMCPTCGEELCWKYLKVKALKKGVKEDSRNDYFVGKFLAGQSKLKLPNGIVHPCHALLSSGAQKDAKVTSGRCW